MSPRYDACRHKENTQLYLYALVTSELDAGVWITPLTGRFTPNREPQCRWYKWLGGLQVLSGWVSRKQKTALGFLK